MLELAVSHQSRPCPRFCTPRSDHELLVIQEIRRRDYDEGRQMQAMLSAKALANEQSRLF